MRTEISNTSIIRPKQLDYTTCQFIFPQEFENMIQNSDLVRTFKRIMGGLNLEKYEINRNTVGRKGYEFRRMLEIVLYAYSRSIYSLRGIEDACKNDIRFMWISGNIKPSHKTIGNFIKYELADSLENIFKEVNDYIAENDHIDTNTIYIDGTKLEANATKFSFVWKKSTLKHQAMLMVKMDKSINDLNAYFDECNVGVSFLAKGLYQVEDFITVFDALKTIKNNVDTIFAKGIGHRKNDFQKFYELFEGYLSKAIDYAEKIEICGNRNSYSKTDHDATFMHGKEDYYNKTGIFKPYYNVQIGVSNEYIRLIGVFQNPADTKTFKPLLEKYKELYGNFPEFPVADAGYGSYDNYMFCLENKIALVQKYPMYEADKNRKNKFATINYRRDDEGNIYCPNGYKFIYTNDTWNDKSEYLKINQNYKVDKCAQCPYLDKCNKSKSKTEKYLSVNPVLEEMKQKVNENLKSELGITQRTRRSIEVEGAFGVIKQDWNYTRIHRRGIDNVRNELFLVAIGFNLKKFHQKTVIRKTMS